MYFIVSIRVESAEIWPSSAWPYMHTDPPTGRNYLYGPCMDPKLSFAIQTADAQHPARTARLQV